MDPRTFWPFRIPTEALETEASKRQICFLERAAQQGHKSFEQGSLIGALANNGREGEMIPRGGLDRGLRRYWEVILSLDSHKVDSFYIDGFENAAEAVLQWLRGEDCSQIKSYISESIVQRPGQHGW